MLQRPLLSDQCTFFCLPSDGKTLVQHDRKCSFERECHWNSSPAWLFGSDWKQPFHPSNFYSGTLDFESQTYPGFWANLKNCRQSFSKKFQHCFFRHDDLSQFFYWLPVIIIFLFSLFFISFLIHCIFTWERFLPLRSTLLSETSSTVDIQHALVTLA